MITIICGTNRSEAVSRTITEIYKQKLEEKGEQVNVIDLGELPPDFIFSALYDQSGTNVDFNRYVEIMNESNKYVFIVPEYNGSFPGVLKAFIDGMEYNHTFIDKTAALVGLSAGVLGGGFALSHLTDILNYCGTTVVSTKPRLAEINKNLVGNQITNTLYNELLELQIKQLVKM